MSVRRSFLGFLVVSLVLVVVLAPSAREYLLRAIGGLLVISDPIQSADLAVVTPESGAAGDLEASDLVHNGGVKNVLVLVPSPLPIDRELTRRGVHYPNFAVDTLVQLGVPKAAISVTDAGEGGTTENTEALAAWARDRRPLPRLIVIVSPTHARRYRRALERVWPDKESIPAVRPTPYSRFRPEDWWRSRTTLRDGVMELEKLALDFVQHPLQ